MIILLINNLYVKKYSHPFHLVKKHCKMIGVNQMLPNFVSFFLSFFLCLSSSLPFSNQLTVSYLCFFCSFSTKCTDKCCQTFVVVFLYLIPFSLSILTIFVEIGVKNYWAGLHKYIIIIIYKSTYLCHSLFFFLSVAVDRTGHPIETNLSKKKELICKR